MFAVEERTGRIVIKDVETGTLSELNIEKTQIYDIAILHNDLLILEYRRGLKYLPKSANGSISAKQACTTGLEKCSMFWSIHVVEGRVCVIRCLDF